MSSPPLRKVQKTGRSWPHRDGTLYEVICPDCSVPQIHPKGQHRCIICSAPWLVTVFDIIRPVKPPEENKGED